MKKTRRSEDATLKRLLSTPPQAKPKKDVSASPKKRGRPAKIIKIIARPKTLPNFRPADSHKFFMKDATNRAALAFLSQ